MPLSDIPTTDNEKLERFHCFHPRSLCRLSPTPPTPHLIRLYYFCSTGPSHCSFHLHSLCTHLSPFIAVTRNCPLSRVLLHPLAVRINPGVEYTTPFQGRARRREGERRSMHSRTRRASNVRLVQPRPTTILAFTTSRRSQDMSRTVRGPYTQRRG